MGTLVIKRCPKGGQQNRLVVVVGTKVSKYATKRNLLKRRIRAIMQPHIKDGDYDYTIIARMPALELSYHELKKETEKGL